MQPKVHPYLKKPGVAPDPLFRRAQLAAHMKEVVKVPTIPSASTSPGALYYLQDSSSDTKMLSSQSGGGIKVPSGGSIVSSKAASVASDDNLSVRSGRSSVKGKN